MTRFNREENVGRVFLVITFLIFATSIARDTWYDYDWKYRMPVTVTENSGNSVSVIVQLCENKMPILLTGKGNRYDNAYSVENYPGYPHAPCHGFWFSAYFCARELGDEF